MRKLIGIISIVIAIMFSFAACNNNTQVENNENKNNNSVEQNNSNVENNNTEKNEEENTNNAEIVDISSFYSGDIVTEPANKTFNVKSSLDNIASVSGLNESTKLSEAQIKEKFNFGKFEGLEKEIRSKVTDDDIKEIVIVKIGDNDQSMVLFQIVTARLANLRVEHKDNEKILAIIENNENLVMKQQGGILISILAENAQEISEELDKQF